MESIDEIVARVLKNSNPENLGMVAIHLGVVRATSKSGKPVAGMKVSFDPGVLTAVVDELKARDGIESVVVKVSSGTLKPGERIMIAVVAGRYRSDVMPVLEELVSRLKGEVVEEEELFDTDGVQGGSL